MKKIFLFGCLFIIAVQFSFAQPNKNEKVQQTMIQLFEAFTTLNVDNIKKYTTTDFTLLEDGQVWNLDSVSVHFQLFKDQLKGATFNAAYTLDFIQIVVQENTAMVAYHNSAVSSINNNPLPKLNWLESAFLTKENNEWKVKMLHSTELKSKSNP